MFTFRFSTIFHVELKKLRKQNKLMEEKLEKYRAKKRRQARINDFKTRLINMVTFQQVRVDSANKNDHVIVQDVTNLYNLPYCFNKTY